MRRTLIALVVVVALAAAAVMAGLWAAGADEHTAPALAAAAVALVAGIVALLPLHWADRRPASAVPMLALAGVGLRGLTTVAGAAALIAGLGLPGTPTALWTLGWYLLVMVFEMTLLIRYFRSFTPAPPSRRDAADERGPRRGS